MTPNEERNYLCELILASSQWRISEGDETDAIRLEVQDRLRRLNGVDTVDENGYCQSEPDNLPAEDEPLTTADYQALEAARLNEHLENKNKPDSRDKWKVDKVRCQENGKVVWHPVSECHQEKLFPNNPNAKKFRWVWDGPGGQVDKLGDELWKDHERS